MRHFTSESVGYCKRELTNVEQSVQGYDNTRKEITEEPMDERRKENVIFGVE